VSPLTLVILAVLQVEYRPTRRLQCRQPFIQCPALVIELLATPVQGAQFGYQLPMLENDGFHRVRAAAAAVAFSLAEAGRGQVQGGRPRISPITLNAAGMMIIPAAFNVIWRTLCEALDLGELLRTVLYLSVIFENAASFFRRKPESLKVKKDPHWTGLVSR